MAWQAQYGPKKVGGGLAGLGDDLIGALQMRRQRQQQEEAEQLAANERSYRRDRDAQSDARQRDQDREQLFLKAQQIRKVQGEDAAIAYLGMHGYAPDGTPRGEAPQQGGGAPAARTGFASGGPQDNQRTFIEDPSRPGTPYLNMTGPAPSSPYTGGPPQQQPPVAPGPTPHQAIMAGGGGDMGDEPAPQQPQFPQPPIMSIQSQNPVVLNRQAEIRQDQERARKLLAFRNGRGDAITLTDPQGEEQVQREQGERMRAENLRVFDGVVGQLDPEMQKYAQEMRPAIGMSTDPVRPVDVLNFLKGRMGEDGRAQAAAAAKEGDREFTLMRDQIQNTAAERRARIAAAAAANRVENKPPTEGQGLANSRLRIVADELAKVENDPGEFTPEELQAIDDQLAAEALADKSPAAALGARKLGLHENIEKKLSPTGKQLYNRYRSFGDVVIRQRTGANAPPGEVANLLRPLMPVAGDDPATLADKKQRRQAIMESFIEQAPPSSRERHTQSVQSIYPGGAAGKPGAGGPSKKNKPPASELDRLYETYVKGGRKK